MSMRKFYLFLAAAALSITASAGITKFERVSHQSPAQTTTEVMQNKYQVNKLDLAQLGEQHNASATSRKAPRRAGEIITTAPEGELKHYTRAGHAMYRNGYSLAEGDQSGIMQVVYAADGEVYMLNPVSNFATGAYVKGTLEGNTITVPVGQQLYNWTEQGYGAELAWVNITRNDNGGFSAAEQDAATTQVTYTVDEAAGTITLEGSSDTHMLGAIYDDDHTFVGYADCNSVYTFTEVPELVTPPAGIAAEEYYYTGKYDGGNGDEELNTKVNVVKDGNDIYFQGLSKVSDTSGINTDSWVKGSIDGNTVTIPMNQFIGEYNGEFTYLTGGSLDTGAMMDITLTYDAQADAYTANVDYFVNSELNRIYYYIRYAAGNLISKEAPVLPDKVTPPAGIEPVAYQYWGAYRHSSTTDLLSSVNVVKDGNDIYFQGLANGNADDQYLPEAWVKGTIDGNKVTIPTGQFLDKVGVDLVYLIGIDAAGEKIADLTMTYDEQADTYTLDNYYAANTAPDAFSMVMYFMPGNVIGKEAPATPEEVVVPDELTLYNYILSTYEVTGQDEQGNPKFNPVTLPITVGVDADYNMYMKGLCQDLPEAWVRCHYDDDYNLVIPTRQYFGTKVESFYGMTFEDPHYLLGLGENGFTDVVLVYDQENDAYVSQTEAILDNAMLNTVNYYHYYANPTLKLVEDKAAKPANPEITDFGYYADYGYGFVECNIPLEDVNGEGLIADKLYYRIYSDIERDVQQLTFGPSTGYTAVELDMTEIPYSFTDDYDIYANGSRVYLNHSDVSEYNRIGIQTVYYGGMNMPGAPRRAVAEPAENESEIVWYNIKDYVNTAINDVNADKAVKSVRYYNVAGCASDVPFNGLNIVVKTYADGTTSTAKVIK